MGLFARGRRGIVWLSRFTQKRLNVDQQHELLEFSVITSLASRALGTSRVSGKRRTQW